MDSTDKAFQPHNTMQTCNGTTIMIGSQFPVTVHSAHIIILNGLLAWRTAMNKPKFVFLFFFFLFLL